MRKGVFYIFITLAFVYIAYLWVKCLITRRNFSNELESFLDCDDNSE